MSNISKKNSKRVLLASSIIAGAIFGAVSPQAVRAENLFNYSNLGSGAEVRTSLLGTTPAHGSMLDMKCGNPTDSKDKNTSDAKAGSSTDSKTKDAKCGEGKCGGDKKSESKAKDHKCGESKCGGDKKSESKAKDHKCGEGKCGGDKKSESKAKDHKCGEAKCGGDKKDSVKTTQSQSSKK